jgi:hypothetical protein
MASLFVISRLRSALPALHYVLLAAVLIAIALIAGDTLPVQIVHHRPPARRVAVPHVRKTEVAVPLPAAKPVAKGPTMFEQEEAMTPTQRMNRWKPYVIEASRRFGVSQGWLWAVMRMESGGRTTLAEGVPITSSAGAMGLMQLMPDTYATMRAIYGLGADPYDPHDNVMAAAAFLHILSAKYSYPALFAAYNDGPALFDKHLTGARPLPAETSNYVAGIDRFLNSGAASGLGLRVRLTRPDGQPVWINSAAVVSIRAALPGEYAPTVRTVIGIGKMRQGVREDVGTATARIRGHGGRL